TRQGLAHPSRHDCPNSEQSLLRRCPVGRSQLIIRSTMYLASGSAGSAGVCALITATLRWWPRLTRNESAGAPTLLWTQLTNFNDSAETPTLSRDGKRWGFRPNHRSEEHTSELQSRGHLVCRLLLEKKKKVADN